MVIFTHWLWDGHHCFYHKLKVLKNNNIKYLYHYVFSKHFILIWIFFFIIHSTLFQFSSLAFILGFCQPWLRTRMQTQYTCHHWSQRYLLCTIYIIIIFPDQTLKILTSTTFQEAMSSSLWFDKWLQLLSQSLYFQLWSSTFSHIIND